MADDARLAELRGLMIEKLKTGPRFVATEEEVVALVLPIVSAWAEQHAARRAAEELRAAVDHLHKRGGIATLRHEDYAAVSLYNAEDHLRARAAALTPASEEKL